MNASGPPAAAALVAHRARPRRRRVHRRRLRDRRAAGARPAVGQPLGQPVRHLRRHERRRADRLAGRQRRHARADDADRQQPGRRRPFRDIDLRHAAAAELPRVRAARRSSCRCTRSAWPRALSAAICGRSRAVDLAIALADALPSGIYTGCGIEEYVRTVAVRPRAHRRLPPARERALPGGHRPRHLRADRARRRGLGRRPDLHAPCAPRPRCRWSTSPIESRAAS